MRLQLLVFLCTITVVAYVQRLALSAPTKVIEGELRIGPEAMGVVLGAWYWGYALAQLPAGWLADRIGSKPALVVFSVAWSLLTALTSLAPDFPSLVILWGLMGCAQAGIFPCCARAISQTFPRTAQAFASGALGASMNLGGAAGQWLTAQLLVSLGWRAALGCYAVPGLVWALAFALALPRYEPTAKARAAFELPADPGPVPWLKLATDRQMQLLNGQQFLRAAAFALFYTWFPRFLKETRGLTEPEAGAVAFWPLLAAAGGGLVGGALSDWLLRQTGSVRVARSGMACAAMAVCAACTLGAYQIADTTLSVALLCLGVFCGAAGGVSAYAVAIAYGGRRAAVVFATMNMSGNVGAGLFPLAVGWLVGLTGSWDFTLLVFAGLFAADAVCWAFLNPTGTLFPESGHPEKTEGPA
jgi:MFS family permease